MTRDEAEALVRTACRRGCDNPHGAIFLGDLIDKISPPPKDDKLDGLKHLLAKFNKEIEDYIYGTGR